ncbi:MAG: ATP-binding protein [Thermodesulfovibrionales bacterium]|nr:ATP-binding protein [Thermodesulfovibrionales bacterium]
MKAGLLKSILLAYLIFSPFLLAGIEYYLLSALLATIVISLLEIKRVEKAISEIAEFSGSITSGDFRKSLFLKGKGAIGELAKNINDLAQNFETRLKEGEEEKYKIEAILMNMSDGLMLTDTKGRILLSNSAIKNFFGVESNIEGRTLMETLRKAELMEVIDRVVKTEETISLEIEVTHPRELYLVATAAPFSVKGEVSGVVLTFYDITGLKQLEDMRKDFVANVSHEIKTPITAIKGFAETLLEGAIDDKENARKFLETIRTHSERMNSLVSDLLTLSRIELGDIKIQKMDVNLDNVVDTVFATLRGKAKNKGLYLKKEISPNAQETKADRDRLIQILLNLVDNGIKFTEEGGVTVKVKREKLKIKSEEEKNVFVISVEDTGIGIPRKHLSRLGERFYRVDRARSRELGGTGLGLAIVKHLVKAHGWEMEIESTQGGETKVKIIIPSVTKI